MRISKLKIRNFRSIETLDMELPQLCALVGPNNAGKSNIMLALHRVLGRDWARVVDFDDVRDRYRQDPDRDVEIVATVDPPITYRKFKAAPASEIHALSFKLARYKKEREGEPRLIQECLDAKGKVVNVAASVPKKGEQLKHEPLHRIPNEVQKELPLIYIRANRTLAHQLPGAQYSVLRWLFEDIDKDFNDPERTVPVEKPDGTSVEMPRAKRWGQLMKAAMDLLRTPKFKELESEINQNALRQLGFAPDTDSDELSFMFGPCDTIDFYRSLELHVREAGLTLNATELGQGFQNALVLAILQAFEQRRKKGAVLLIEEPEISLHPQGQRALYSTLMSISADNQVVYATHSPHFVGVPDYETVRLVRRTPDGTKVRKSKLAPSDGLRERLRKEADPERSELFFARRLLLVEGDTEKLALPEYAKRLGIDLDRAGATIVEVGGKRNLMNFAELAASFEIPTGVLYDTDSGNKEDREDDPEMNTALENFDDAEKQRVTWALNEDYESVLRTALTEQRYQELCQAHPKLGKPTRARLIAEDPSTPIPPELETALRWLESGSSTQTEQTPQGGDEVGVREPPG